MKLTQKSLMSALDYDEQSGVFTWREGRRLGREAGSAKAGGYRYVKVFGEDYLAHRLAWLYMTGGWPDDTVDHIDGDKLNNAWANLRAATYSENSCNCGIRSHNKVGLKGVVRRGKRFVSTIILERKQRYLGTFDTPDAAHEAYCRASRELHGEYGRTT